MSELRSDYHMTLPRRLLGNAPAMTALLRQINQVSQSRHPVLILGETGTGKELVARTVHENSTMCRQPFFPVDCASLVPSLAGSELFGHVRGAFTGALQTRQGMLAAAREGTVFLDEIGELPLSLQAALLRVLQEKEVRPIGSTSFVKIGARIIAATNRNLKEELERGTFRADLYFRLNVVTLTVPPLRERKEDIPLLAAHFLANHFPQADRRPVLSEEVVARLMAYDWPGNVRELQNCIEYVATLCSAPIVRVADLPPHVRPSRHSAAAPMEHPNSVVPLSQLEEKAIRRALAAAHGKKLLAAKLLHIGKSTLYRKLREYSLEPAG